MAKKKLIIAIDFDNTIASSVYSGGITKIYGLIDGAKEYIDKLHADGHYIIIWTCRESKNQNEAEKFLKDNNIYYDRINANSPKHFETFNHDCRKIFADVYVDDAGILGIPPWKDIYEIISKKANNYGE